MIHDVPREQALIESGGAAGGPKYRTGWICSTVDATPVGRRALVGGRVSAARQSSTFYDCSGATRTETGRGLMRNSSSGVDRRAARLPAGLLGL